MKDKIDLTDTQTQKKRFSWRILLCALIVLNNFVIIVNNLHAKADVPVAITTPSQGQTLDSANPTIAGTAPSGKFVDIEIDNGYAGTVRSDDNGNWQYQAQNLSNTSHSVKASVTDGDAYFGSQTGGTAIVKTSINRPLAGSTTTYQANLSGPTKTVFSPDSSRAYVLDPITNKVNVIDTNTKQITNVVSFSTQSKNIAISGDGHWVIVMCDFGIERIDTTNIGSTGIQGIGLWNTSGNALATYNDEYYAAGNFGNTLFFGKDDGSSQNTFGIGAAIKQISPINDDLVLVASADRVWVIQPSTDALVNTLPIEPSMWPADGQVQDPTPIKTGGDYIYIPSPTFHDVTVLPNDLSDSSYQMPGLGDAPYDSRTVGRTTEYFSLGSGTSSRYDNAENTFVATSPQIAYQTAYTGMQISPDQTRVYVASQANPPNVASAQIETLTLDSNSVTNTTHIDNVFSAFPYLEPGGVQLWNASPTASSLSIFAPDSNAIIASVTSRENAGAQFIVNPGDDGLVYTSGSNPADYGQIRLLSTGGGGTGEVVASVDIGGPGNAQFILTHDNQHLIAFNATSRTLDKINAHTLAIENSFTQDYPCNTGGFDANNDGTKIFCSDGSGGIRAYDDSGNILGTYDLSAKFGSALTNSKAKVSSDGNTILVANGYEVVRYDINQDQFSSSTLDDFLLPSGTDPASAVTFMNMNPAGNKLYFGGANRVKSYDISDGNLNLFENFQSNGTSTNGLQFSGDGKRAFTAFATTRDDRPDIGYVMFDTESDKQMGTNIIETYDVTGSSIGLAMNVNVVESTTVSFSVQQPVIITGDGNFTWMQNSLFYLAIPTQYDQGPMTAQLISGTLPPGVSIDMCHWDGPLIPCFEGTPTQTGTFDAVLQITDGITSSQKSVHMTVVSLGFVNPNNQQPNIVLNPVAVVGQNYDATLSTQNSVGNVAITETAGDVWSGMTAEQQGNDWHIYGTPTQTGNWCFTLHAQDDLNQTDQAYCLNVVASHIAIDTMSLPDGTLGTNYNQTIALSGGAGNRSFSVTTGALPPGLDLTGGSNPDEIVVSGIPTSAGIYTFNVRVTDDTGNTDQQYIINIAPGITNPLTITTSSLPRGRTGIPYDSDSDLARVQVVNAQGTLGYSVLQGSLPTGLSLNSGYGTITGTPSQAGNFTFTIGVDDDISSTTKEYTIHIDPTPAEPPHPSVHITSHTNGNTFSGPTQTVSGTATPAYSTIQLSVDHSAPYDVQVDGNGHWSYQFTGLGSGQHSFEASLAQAPHEFAYVTNAFTKDITIINTANDTIYGTLPLPGDQYAGSIQVSSDGTKAYVFGESIDPGTGAPTKVSIYELDTASNTFTRSLDINGINVYGITISPDSKNAYFIAADQNFDPSLKQVDLSTMTIINTTNLTLGQNIAAPGQNDQGFFHMAMNQDGSKLFFTNSGANYVTMMNTSDHSLNTIDIGYPTSLIALSPSNTLYTTEYTPNPVANPRGSILDAQTGSVLSQLTSDTHGAQVKVLSGMFIQSNGSTYIASREAVDTGQSQQSIISLTDWPSLSPLAAFTTQSYGNGLAINHDHTKLYLPNLNGTSWGSVDVLSRTLQGILAGTKYPIPVGIVPYDYSTNWIASVPQHNFTDAVSINIVGGANSTNSGDTTITLPQFKFPTITIPNIKPFTLPSFNFNPSFNIPNLAPLNGIPASTSQQTSKTNAGFFGNALNTLKTSVSLVPTKVALAFPYLLLLVLIIMILSLLAQTRDELEKARQLKRVLAKRRSLEDERNNFISLISHYLNTPISMMQGGVDLISTLKRAPKSMTDSLQKTLSAVGQKVKSLLSSTSQISTEKPSDFKIPHTIKPYQSFSVMAPVILVAVMTALTNWLFNSAGVVDISIINIFTQVMAFALLIQALFATYKHHQTAEHSLALAQASLDNEVVMAEARLHFLSSSVNELKAEVSGLRRNLPGLAAAPNAKAVKDGYVRLQSILNRLQLLTEIEQNQHIGQVESFKLLRAVETVVSQYKPQLAQRKIKLDIEIPSSLSLTQDKQMLELVISSLVDNAVKFAPKNDGYIRIVGHVVKGRVEMSISDNGMGIAKSKIPQLFKPFSRGESALRFNYEGLGLSLYLDKVIIDKLGGTIEITSSKGNGTRVTIQIDPKLPKTAPSPKRKV